MKLYSKQEFLKLEVQSAIGALSNKIGLLRNQYKNIISRSVKFNSDNDEYIVAQNIIKNHPEVADSMDLKLANFDFDLLQNDLKEIKINFEKCNNDFCKIFNKENNIENLFAIYEQQIYLQRAFENVEQFFENPSKQFSANKTWHMFYHMHKKQEELFEKCNMLIKHCEKLDRNSFSNFDDGHLAGR